MTLITTYGTEYMQEEQPMNDQSIANTDLIGSSMKSLREEIPFACTVDSLDLRVERSLQVYV